MTTNTPGPMGTSENRRVLDRDVTTTTTAAPEVSPAERCDRCGARAVIRAVMPGGGDLVFCAHHGRQHGAQLRATAVEIRDDEGVLGAP